MDVAMKLDFNDSDDNEDTVNSSLDDCSQFDISSSITLQDIYKQSHYNDHRALTANRFPTIPEENSPPYKRIRALRLFDSPATPKTLLQKCAADSTSSSSSSSQCSDASNFEPSSLPRFARSRLGLSRLKNSDVRENSQVNTPPSQQNYKCQHDTDCKEYANINPFTPHEMMMSRKRPRKEFDYSNSFNQSDDASFTSDSHMDDQPEMAGSGESHSEMRHQSLDPSYHSTPDHHPKSSPTKRVSIHKANVSRYHEEFVEIELIGQGKFGGVYKCRHRLDGCEYAIKKSLKPVAGSANERIALNEVYAHAVLGKHPHVVRYYSAWAENNHMIIQNEYCNGGSLAERIEENKKNGVTFSELQLKQLLFHISKGLKYIHSQQLIHLDIKPENIFLSMEPRFNVHGEESADEGIVDEFTEDNELELTYKIGDLGHVTSIVNPQVEEGDCRYLPREILQDNFSHLCKADIFALGLTLYELASIRPLPLNGTEWHALRDGNFEFLEKLSPDLQYLLSAMTHKDPQKRPSSVQLVQLLAEFHHSANKSQVQLRKELNAEKFKNEILSRKLEETVKCLNATAVVQSPSTQRTNSPAGSSRLRSISKVYRNGVYRNAPATRKASRLVGKMMTRSCSNNF